MARKKESLVRTHEGKTRGRFFSLVTAIGVVIAVASTMSEVSAWTPTTPQVNVSTFAGTALNLGQSIALDPSGNILSTGRFDGTVDFDPGVGVTNLTSLGSGDVYIAKLDSLGELVWAKSFGSTTSDAPYSVATDSAGNVYVTGNYQLTVDFDPSSGVAQQTSNGTNDIFVVKLDANGNFVWVKTFGGGGSDSGYSVVADSTGNVYVTGNFLGTVDFDPGAGTSNLTDAGSWDAFILKLDVNGNFVWARNVGGTSTDNGYSLKISPLGYLYVVGIFQLTADFDPGAGIESLTSYGNADGYVLKLDLMGNFVWVRQFGGTGGESSQLVLSDSSDNVFVVGSFSNTADFDGSANTANLTSAGGIDGFVLKLDATGAYQWAHAFGGTGNDIARSVAHDSQGSVYATGYFANTVDFDPGAGTVNLTSVAADDGFVVKLDATGGYSWVQQIGDTGSGSGYSLAMDSSDSVFVLGHFAATADFDTSSCVANIVSAGSSDAYILKLDSSGQSNSANCGSVSSTTTTTSTTVANSSTTLPVSTTVPSTGNSISAVVVPITKSTTSTGTESSFSIPSTGSNSERLLLLAAMLLSLGFVLGRRRRI